MVIAGGDRSVLGVHFRRDRRRQLAPWRKNLSKNDEVTREYDEPSPETNIAPSREEGVAVPVDRINSETLRILVTEFVTREWSDLADADFSLETKVEQVLEQLRKGEAKVVFDLVSETCNIVLAR